MPKPIRKAVFPVAGLGTRFLPATKAMPKEMLPVVDKPLIQYAVEEAQQAGIEEFVFVTGRAKSAIEDHFDHSVELEQILRERGADEALKSVLDWMPPPGHISYTRQQEPMGLGHAVWCARNFIGDEPFAVLLADDLILSATGCLKQMVEVHREMGGNLVAIEEVPKDQVKSYGILDLEEDFGRCVRAKGLVEKPAPDKAPSRLGIIGRYILEPIVLTVLEHQDRGAGNEIQLTDAMARTIGLVPFHGVRFEGTRFDCGNKLGYLEANLAFALHRSDMNSQLRAMLRKYLDAEVPGSIESSGTSEAGKSEAKQKAEHRSAAPAKG
ncbi:MAG: UTP--glucose-1-phosphate uridylyltransferase GalU [Rhodospirillales bacterium]|nr:UTP--glucose-1-phosphate uridylyltransferase GalU [Rhodospirillales bacterium]